jgi:hypothetical protein
MIFLGQDLFLLKEMNFSGYQVMVTISQSQSSETSHNHRDVFNETSNNHRDVFIETSHKHRDVFNETSQTNYETTCSL